jgi:ComEC/Rec2-related protein
MSRIVVLLRGDFPLLFVAPPFIAGQQCAPLVADSPMILTQIVAFLLLFLFGRARGEFCRVAYFFIGGCLAATLLSSVSGFHYVPLNKGTQWKRIQGRVVDTIRYPKPGEIQFGLRIVGEPQRGDSEGTEFNVLCKGTYLPWRNSAQLREGNVVKAKIKIKGLDGVVDWYRHHLSARGYYGTCKVKALAIVDSGEEVFSALRRSVRERVYEVLGRNESVGLLLATAIGSRDQIGKVTEDAFRCTGLMHLLVLSGFQLTVVFGSVSLLARRVLGKSSWIRAVCSVNLVSVGLGLFSVMILLILAGLEHSSTRAAVAMLLVALGMWWERRVHLSNSILASIFLLSLVWPSCIFDLGVQLTYAALFGILIGSSDKNGLRSYLSCSLWCSVCTSLVLLLRGQGISLGGFVLNPLLSGVCSFVGTQLGLCALGLLLCGIDRHGLFAFAVVWVLEKFKYLIRSLSEIEGIYYDGSSLMVSVLLIFVLGSVMAFRVFRCWRSYLYQYGYK